MVMNAAVPTRAMIPTMLCLIIFCWVGGGPAGRAPVVLGLVPLLARYRSAGCFLKLLPAGRRFRAAAAGAVAPHTPENEPTHVSNGGSGSSVRPEESGGENCEEECEIDWSRMPGGAPDDEVPVEETQTSASLLANNNNNNDKEAVISETVPSSNLPPSSSVFFDLEEVVEITTTPIAQPRIALPTTTPAAPAQEHSGGEDRARVRLEMAWQLHESAEDCDVERPTTCGSEPCQACRGRGRTICRFCHGTALLALDQRCPPCVCTICRDGLEVCKSCQGSGWVAEWTHLQHFNNQFTPP